MSSPFATQGRLSSAGFGPTWGRLVALGSLFIVVAIAYLPTTLSLLSEWNDTVAHTYTHGFLVLGVSLWLLVRDRAALTVPPVSPSYASLVPLVLVGFTSVVVQRGGIEIGHQLLLPLIMWLSVLATLGWGIARLCAFPLGYLYFAVPIWSHINDQLQSLTVAAVQVMLRASGIPAYFAGNSVEIPSGLFEIEDGCSGLHFFIVALAMAALLGELQGDRLRVRMRHIVLGGLLAIIANWLRVYIIIVAGHLTSMQHYLVTVDHYYFGWLVFAVAMTVFLAVSRSEGNESLDRPQSGLTPVEIQPGPLLAGALLAVLALALPPTIALSVANRTSAGDSLVPSSLQIEGWTGPEPAGGEWHPVFSGADQQRSVAYLAGDRRLELFVASYYSQHQGKELIGYLNSFLAPMRALSVQRLKWRGASVNEHLAVDGRGQQWLVWSFYTVGSRAFTSGIASGLWYGFRSLAGPIESRAVAMRMKCTTDCASARDSLGEALELESVYPGRSEKEMRR